MDSGSVVGNMSQPYSLVELKLEGLGESSNDSFFTSDQSNTLLFKRELEQLKKDYAEVQLQLNALLEENAKLKKLLEQRVVGTGGGRMTRKRKLNVADDHPSQSITSGQTEEEDNRQNVLENDEEVEYTNEEQNLSRSQLMECGICKRVLPTKRGFVNHLTQIHKLSIENVLLQKFGGGAVSANPKSLPRAASTEDQPPSVAITLSAIKEEVDAQLDVSINCPRRPEHDLVEGIPEDSLHPYVCTCKKKYKQLKTFEIHRKAELSPRKYPCDRCESCFGQLKGLNMHKRMAHLKPKKKSKKN